MPALSERHDRCTDLASQIGKIEAPPSSTRLQSNTVHHHHTSLLFVVQYVVFRSSDYAHIEYHTQARPRLRASSATMPGELDELFARLRAQPSIEPQASQSSGPSIWAQSQSTYQPPSVSSPIFSPPIQTPNPTHASQILSPVQAGSTSGTPASTSDTQRTDNLLNLLRFNNKPNQSGASASPMASLQNVAGARSSSHSFQTHAGGENTGGPRPLSAQDLMASLQRKPSAPGVLPPSLAAQSTEKPSQPAASRNQQDFLLDLLRRPNTHKPVQPAPSESVVPSIEKEDPAVERLAQSFASASVDPKVSSEIKREPTPVRQFGSAASRETTPFEAPQSGKASMFSYVNPFDQLHASSPLNRTPKPEGAESKNIEILKHDREISSSANGDGPAAKSRKMEPTPEPKTVSEKLEGVAQQVDKQVEDALAEAGRTISATGDNTADPMDDAGKDDDIESSWESAEDSANDKKLGYKVLVYNFPMKPFVSITINSGSEKAIPVRQDEFMVVAQLKKEFDQMDRSLVAASRSHIVYAQTSAKKDNAGFRIIRQDTGDHKQVFRHSAERIFSVQLCTSATPGSDIESVLGSGVNGSVFWTSLAKSHADLFAEDDVEPQGFILPAIATPEENTSGSPVKTRAKCSNRHTDFFALSRSKIIYIVSPATAKERAYCDPKTRKVDADNYFAERSLRINTGKAGKDFAFSEDDSVIASLDKSGVVKFWDIRKLIERATDMSQGKHDPIELKDPLWSLNAAAIGGKGDEKPSVSSVMLLDKERPHNRGVALRYMLVGFKQNHILQLWDLGLGKAVQELRLPHEKDSDGFCSINYHPRTGIITIGHPTRNLVYLIHLSAPKYNVPFMPQAEYISLLARGDPKVPRPDSTAIMSGIRSFSFDKVGQLRSLEMLKTPVDNAGEKNTMDETLFELYVMHSKGVVGIPIKRADLGWDDQSKMLHPVDAVETGVISVGDLDMKVAPVKEPRYAPASDIADTPSKKKEAKKPEPAKPGPPPSNASSRRAVATASPSAATNGAQRATPVPELAQSKQIPEAPSATNPPIITADAYTKTADDLKASKEDPAVPKAADGVKDVMAEPLSVSSAASADLLASFNKQFDSLYQRLDADKRVAEAAGSARQDAMLRLVSSTLTENVEQSLHRIIGASIEKQVIPVIAETTRKAIEAKLAELLPQQLSTIVQREIKAALPQAVQNSLNDQAVHRSISEVTSNQVSHKVQQQVSQMLQQQLPNKATQATQKMISDLEARTNQRLREAETQRQQANKQIEQLSSLVQGLSATVQQMANSQAAFQEQILKMQQTRNAEKSARTPDQQSQSATSNLTVGGSEPPKSAEEKEVDAITKMLMDGEYEQATIQVCPHLQHQNPYNTDCLPQWLQSPTQAHLFDALFVRVNPAYLSQVTPLVALSVSAAITASLDTNLPQRLEWLEQVLGMINVRDPDIVDVAPKIMDVLSQRLQGVYMEVAERRPGDSVLRRIAELVRKVGEVKRVVG